MEAVASDIVLAEGEIVKTLITEGSFRSPNLQMLYL